MSKRTDERVDTLFRYAMAAVVFLLALAAAAYVYGITHP